MGAGIAEVCGHGRSRRDRVRHQRRQPSAAGRARIEDVARARGPRGEARRGRPRRRADAGRASPPTSASSPIVSSWSRPSSSSSDEKLEVFRNLDKIVVDEQAILASNTSSIPIMKLAMATDRPEHVLGLHFFNPVPVSASSSSSRRSSRASDVADRAEDFMADALGKRVIRSQDRAGFIVNFAVRALRARGDPHARVGVRLGRRHRRRHGRGLLAPDGPARARRPDRARHHRGGRRLDVRGVQGAALRASAAALAAWSRPGCSAASAAAASSTTPSSGSRHPCRNRWSSSSRVPTA